MFVEELSNLRRTTGPENTLKWLRRSLLVILTFGVNIVYQSTGLTRGDLHYVLPTVVLWSGRRSITRVYPDGVSPLLFLKFHRDSELKFGTPCQYLTTLCRRRLSNP